MVATFHKAFEATIKRFRLDLLACFGAFGHKLSGKGGREVVLILFYIFFSQAVEIQSIPKTNKQYT